MATIELIVGSVGRLPALIRLFDSLVAQEHKDFSVLVLEQVDLNGVNKLVDGYSQRIQVSCLPSPRGLSVARNVGLEASTSSLVAFPDDDCWFPPNLISMVMDKFGKSRDVELLAGRVVSPTGRPLSRSPDVPVDVNRHNVWTTVMSTATFMRRTAIEAVGAFDETLGVGSPGVSQSGEETDYALRVLEAGLRARYEPSLRVSHPDFSGVPGRQSSLVGRRYGNGMGRVLRKHQYSPPSVAKHLIRPLLGAGVAVAAGDIALARFRLAVTAGRLHGYVSPNEGKRR